MKARKRKRRFGPRNLKAKRFREARCLATGYLCSERMFGCIGDDDSLEATLASVATPDEGGWHRVSQAAWRRYGTTTSGQRVYVEVRDPDWSPHITPPRREHE